jgi:prepilin-type N-terminal cleavage/methylation domain-containing protein
MFPQRSAIVAPAGDARAFTLIELLVVIGIIAVLALVALPNFLEAQTRAKVARALADMGAVATALEAYCVDYGAYPPNDNQYNTTAWNLTSPVAYLASKRLVDPFAERLWDKTYGEAARWYTYGVVVRWDGVSRLPPHIELIDHHWFNHGALAKYGPWRMCSLGPDSRYSDLHVFLNDYPLYGADVPYDTSNGTVSWGNILRTQKSAAGRASD